MLSVPLCLLAVPATTKQNRSRKNKQPKPEHKTHQVMKGASPLAGSVQTRLLLQTRAGLAPCVCWIAARTWQLGEKGHQVNLGYPTREFLPYGFHASERSPCSIWLLTFIIYGVMQTRLMQGFFFPLPSTLGAVRSRSNKKLIPFWFPSLLLHTRQAQAQFLPLLRLISCFS